MNWALAYQVAKFVIWLVLNVREFVLDAEERDPLPGRGASKKAALVEALTVAANVAGMADTAIEAVKNTGFIDRKIDEAVDTAINAGKPVAK